MSGTAAARWGASLYAFTAGFVDTVGFVGLFGLFTAHVTGNFVLIGAAVADPRLGVVAKLAALPVFMAGVALTSLFLRRCDRRGRDPARGVLAAQGVLLAAFALTGALCSPFARGDQPWALLAGMLGVLAMAIQNAASRTVFAALSPTTVMTGNVTQVVLDLVELAHGPDAATRARVGRMLPPVLAFAGGAVAGGLGFALAGFASLLAPIAAVAVLFALQRPARSAAAAAG